MVNNRPFQELASGRLAQSKYEFPRSHHHFGRLFLFVACCTLTLGAIPSYAQWTQVWGDNFNGAANTHLQSRKLGEQCSTE